MRLKNYSFLTILSREGKWKWTNQLFQIHTIIWMFHAQKNLGIEQLALGGLKHAYFRLYHLHMEWKSQDKDFCWWQHVQTSFLAVVLWESRGGRKKRKARSGGGQAIARPCRRGVKALQDPYEYCSNWNLKQPKCFSFCFCQTVADQKLFGRTSKMQLSVWG